MGDPAHKEQRGWHLRNNTQGCPLASIDMQMHIHTHLNADLTGSDGMGLLYMETSYTESRLSILSFKTNSLQYKMIPKVDSDSLLHLTPSLSRHTQIKVS